MGRYISGDIDGKFWFALQPSDAADRFGVTGTQPETLEYWFDEENLETVEEEIEIIINSLSKYKNLLDDFFNDNNSYNIEKLSNYLQVSEKKVKKLIRDYADLELGIKIRDCIKQRGSCNFSAEL
jgi:hypothetical protein